MLTALEEAVAAATAAALAEDAGASAIAYVVRAATSREEVPGDQCVVAVRAQQEPRAITGLLDAVVEIVVGTPAVNEETSVADHREMERAVTEAWLAGRMVGEEEEAQEIGELLAQEIEARLPGWTGAGWFCQGWSPGREDTHWMPALALKVGAVREADL
jgi:hypothetical protein